MEKSIETRVKEVVFSSRKEPIEIIGDLQVAISLAVIKKMDIYIYGAGNGILAFVRYLQDEGVEIKNIIDADINKKGKLLGGIEIVTLDDVKDKVGCDNTFVFVYTQSYRGMAHNGIIDKLFANGIPYVYHVPFEETKELIACREYWTEYFMVHVEELIDFAEKLVDEESVETLLEYLRTYVEGGRWRRKQIPSRYKYFCDDDGREIYRHLDDEIWLNCGSNVGDTIFTFFRQKLEAKKIYAVEGGEFEYRRLKENVGMLPEKLRNVVELRNVFIDEKLNMEEFFGKETQITLINADIEGAELNLLKALESVIKRDRPVISICVYHRREDLIEIPRYIESISKEYSFYLRKYATNNGDVYGTYELVLYAVPRERRILDEN